MPVFFFNFLLPSTVISQHLRLDRGTETGIMATIHAYLRQTDEYVDDASNTVHYGPSTNNKVTELSAGGGGGAWGQLSPPGKLNFLQCLILPDDFL